MRRIVWTLVGLGLAIVATPAAAQQAPSPGMSPAAPARKPATPQPGAAKAKAAPDPRMDEILRLWEAESQKTTSLSAKFTREDKVHDWDTITLYQGAAHLQEPNRAYLNFEKIDEATKKPAFNERIVCTGDRVYQFLAETKQVNVYALAMEQRRRAMEEGPLPFLFNMKAGTAKARYRMTLVQENPAQWLIGIQPLKEIDRDAFSRAYVSLDKQKFVPTRIVLVDPSNDKDTKTFKFTDVKRNVQVNPGFFDGLKQSQDVAQKGWNVVMHKADGEPLEKPAAAAAARPRAGDGTVLARPPARPQAAPRR